MEVDWSLYEGFICNGVAGNKRETAINDSVNAFMTGMVDDPGYQEYSMINGQITPIIASRKTTIKCEIKAPPSTNIHIGDMIECFDEHWIVVELHADKVGIISGEMWLCNNTLRFQNRSTAVISRHCVIDDGTYSKKSSDPDVFVMTNTYKIYITIDDATKRLFVDKRLSFGQIYSSEGEPILEVYKIIGIDIKSKNFGAGSHLMVITVQRDVYNPQTDSISENICDIFANNKDDATPSVTGNCEIAGRDTIRLGTSRKYTAIFTDESGAIVATATPVWAVTVPDGITYDISGTECTIKVPLSEKYVGATITISLSDTENVFGNYDKKVQVITVG